MTGFTFDQSTIDAFSALGLGFAFAGMLASGFEWLAKRPLGFGQLRLGGAAGLAFVPMIVFSAPLLIVRNVVRARRFERRPVHVVMLATIVACFWSLLSGRLVFDAAVMLAG